MIALSEKMLAWSKEESKVLASGSILLAAMMTTIVLLAASSAHASTTFTITSTGDGADANLDDSVCDASVSILSSPCTLRAAIEEANHTPGADAIHFNIPGSGVKTISPITPLPMISETVTIDGYTQPGASPNTLAKGTNAVLKVALDGTKAGEGSGLVIGNISDSVVRGLVINRFEAGGICIYGWDNKVEGNFIGTDPSGNLDRGNLLEGVYVNGDPTNTIGGTSPAARNLISGNDLGGVRLEGGAGSVVSGNLIGTTKNGVKPLGNSGYGVYITDSDENSVGGTSAASANTIAFNGHDGVSINGAGGDNDAVGNGVLRNSIFSNAWMGIDLDTNGPTPNDVGDADSGTNDFQNYPVLSSATTSAGGTTTVGGTLSSNSFEAFKIQFFSNPSGDEGKRFIGEKTVVIWGSGQVSFTFTPSQAVPAGQNVTATATDSSGNTSEFSMPRTVVAS